MQLGIMDTIVRAENLDQSLQAAAALGAEGVEVFYRQANSLEQPGHAKYLKELSGKHGVAIPSLCLGFLAQQPSLIGPAEIVATAQVLIRRGLSVAAEIGAAVILVPCLGKNAIELEDELTRTADALEELVDEAEDAGVIVGIESNLNFDQQRFLLSCLGNPQHAKVYYDTANTLSRKLDVAIGIRDLGLEAIAQVHFKDVRLSEGEPPDYDVALGKGNVDFRAVAQALRAIGYDGWIILETPPVDDPLRSAAANLAFAREVLGIQAPSAPA